MLANPAQVIDLTQDDVDALEYLLTRLGDPLDALAVAGSVLLLMDRVLAPSRTATSAAVAVSVVPPVTVAVPAWAATTACAAAPVV